MSLAMFERLADGLGIPRPLLGLADSQHDHDEAAPGRTREEPSREVPAIRSVDFVAWLAEQSRTSFRVVYDRLAAGSSSSRASQTRTAAITPTCMAGSPASKSSPPWPNVLSNAAADGLHLLQRAGGCRTMPTTVLVRPGWLSTRIPLGAEAERFEYVSPSVAPIPPPHSEVMLTRRSIASPWWSCRHRVDQRFALPAAGRSSSAGSRGRLGHFDELRRLRIDDGPA